MGPWEAKFLFQTSSKIFEMRHFDIIIISKLESKNVNVCEEIQEMKYNKRERLQGICSQVTLTFPALKKIMTCLVPLMFTYEM